MFNIERVEMVDTGCNRCDSEASPWLGVSRLLGSQLAYLYMHGYPSFLYLRCTEDTLIIPIAA